MFLVATPPGRKTAGPPRNPVSRRNQVSRASLWLASELADAVWVTPSVDQPPPGVVDLHAPAEVLRVLRPGGVLTVSDIVLTQPLPAPIRDSISAYVGCVAGASLRDDYLGAIRDVGFEQVEVVGEAAYAADALLDLPDVKQIVEESSLSRDEARAAAGSVTSIKVRAIKP